MFSCRAALALSPAFFQKFMLEIIVSEKENICYMSWQFCHLNSSLFMLSKQD